MLKFPYLPGVALCGTSFAAPASRSTHTSWPLVLSCASVSVSVLASLVSIDTSSVPVIVTITVALPPSRVDTTNDSETSSAGFNWFKA